MIFAISIEAPAIPPNPNSAAINATTKNISAHFIMIFLLFLILLYHFIHTAYYQTILSEILKQTSKEKFQLFTKNISF